MKNRMYIFCCLAVSAAMMLQGCVGYRNVPRVSAAAPDIEYPDLKYRYTGTGGMFGGTSGLKDLFRKGGYFRSVERVSVVVDKGLFIDVRIRSISPSIPAIAFGYISVSTLTLLPFWSTQDGYEVLFDLYRDGKRLKSYEYEFRRNSFIWAPMVALIWVNAFTPSEYGSFEAVGRKFLDDARPVIMGKT